MDETSFEVLRDGFGPAMVDAECVAEASPHGGALYLLGYMAGMGFAEENADAEILGRRQQVVAQLIARLLYGIELEVGEDE